MVTAIANAPAGTDVATVTGRVDTTVTTLTVWTLIIKVQLWFLFRAEMKCYYQAPQKRTCSDECKSVQKGKWNSATGDCQVKSALTGVCLVSDKQNNPQLRKLSGKDVSGGSPPPNSAGCIWDSKSSNFVPAKYTPVAYDSITKQSFNVQLVSGKDPWYLAPC